MTALKTVMKQRNIKYFSQLTQNQKDKAQKFFGIKEIFKSLGIR